LDKKLEVIEKGCREIYPKSHKNYWAGSHFSNIPLPSLAKPNVWLGREPR